jgi:hypothetical protein
MRKMRKDRSTEEIDYERNMNECTFKPNQGITKLKKIDKFEVDIVDNALRK